MKSRILLTALIIFVVFSCRRKSSDDYEYYKPYDAKSSSIADSITAADSLKMDDVVKPEPESINIKGVDISDNYFIVVASYTVEDFAITKMEELLEQGNKPAIIMTNNDGWYKLAVESYSTLDNAKTALPNCIRKGGIFSDARIVFKKNR